MLLADLAALGSFVSGVAVLGSLAFLFFQMRQITAQIEQTERNQKASIRTARASRTVDVMMAFVEPSAAEAVLKGAAASEAMTSVQIMQYTLFCLSRFTNAEDAFAQRGEGLLDDSAFAYLTTSLKVSLAAPGFRTGWQLLRGQFHGDFLAFMDTLLAETPLAFAADPTDRWRAGFAAAKASAGA